jgi:glycosyltransferase involved in cell wall biosynthesis
MIQFHGTGFLYVKEKMAQKIALITATLLGGGVERVMINLAEAIHEKDDYDAVLIVISDVEGQPTHQPPNDVTIMYLHKKRVITSVAALRNLLKDHHWDGIITAQEHVNVALWLAMKTAKASVPWLPVVHSTLSMSLKKSPYLLDKLIMPVVRWLYPRLKRVGAVSLGVKDDLVNAFGLAQEQVVSLPNPVISNTILRDSVNFQDNERFDQVVAAGRLVPEKGFDVLIRAFHIFVQAHDFSLIILGEGPERENLNNLINELGLTRRVLLPGFMPDPYPYMRSARMFVLSSRYEGLPTVLIEAMAYGTPVVATDCRSGPAEILDGGRYGVLVPVDDPQALAEGMSQALNNPVESQALRQRALLFSYEGNIDYYLQLLKDISYYE